MQVQLHLIGFSLLSGFVRAEERLSWFSRDKRIKQRTFVPDNLSEGREENRVMPWVFHEDDESYEMNLKCIMRGYNTSNNPSDYHDARWSHQGFSDSQVDTTSEPEPGIEGADQYRIWTISITTSAADAGKKWATCEFQQGDFPLSIDFKFLIFRRISPPGEENVVYDFGGTLDDSDITQQVEEDIKKQISQQYSMSASDVIRSGQKFRVTVPRLEDPIQCKKTVCSRKCFPSGHCTEWTDEYVYYECNDYKRTPIRKPLNLCYPYYYCTYQYDDRACIDRRERPVIWL